MTEQDRPMSKWIIKRVEEVKSFPPLIKGFPSVLLALISPLIERKQSNQDPAILNSVIHFFFQSNFGRTEKSRKSSQRLWDSHSPVLSVCVIADERTASGDWHFKQSEGFSSEKAVSGMVMRERVERCREHSQPCFPCSLPPFLLFSFSQFPSLPLSFSL